MSRFQTARLVRSEKRKVKIGLIFKKWAIPGLFLLYFLIFNTVDRKQVFIIIFADYWI